MRHANWTSPRRALAAGVVVAVLAGGGAAFAATGGGSDGTSAGAARLAASEEGRRGGFAAALAAELGLEEDAVRAALEAVREARPGPEGFVSALASELGIETATVEAALKRVALDRVDELLEAGRITEEQAAERRAEIEAGRILPPPGRHHRHGPPLKAAAEYLEMSVAEVREAARGGQSLAQVATARGKTVDGLVAAMVADATERIEQAVEDGRLTESEAQERIAGLEERISELVQRAGPLGPGRPGERPEAPAEGEGSAT